MVESYKKQNRRHGKSHHLLVKNTIGRLPLQENEIVSTSEMFVIRDQVGWIVFSESKTLRMLDQVEVIIDRLGLSKHGDLSRRHGKRTNLTFPDGHAESLRAEQRMLPTREVSRL